MSEQKARDYIERAKDALVKDVDHFDAIGTTDLAWLAAQLANWPTRVDERYTTNDRFLRMSAAQFIVNSLSALPVMGEIERKRIVEWLRKQTGSRDPNIGWWDFIADAIERGDHNPTADKEQVDG